MSASRHGGLAALVRELDAASRSAAHYPELPALAGMRERWNQLHADSRLRITLQQAPAEGGPLNSAVLVHRMLTLMQDTSPGYLRHFVAYADALSWLEQMQQAGALSGTAATAAPRARSATRRRPR